MDAITYLTFFSVFSFLFFGTACFTSKHMKTEFIRYELTRFRKVIGGLQILGALGLAFGYFYETTLQATAAAGLTILMILGFVVRLKIKDSLFQSAPSFFYAVLNAIIFLLLLKE